MRAGRACAHRGQWGKVENGADAFGLRGGGASDGDHCPAPATTRQAMASSLKLKSHMPAPRTQAMPTTTGESAHPRGSASGRMYGSLRDRLEQQGGGHLVAVMPEHMDRQGQRPDASGCEQPCGEDGEGAHAAMLATGAEAATRSASMRSAAASARLAV